MTEPVADKRAYIGRARAGDKASLEILLAQSYAALRARIASKVPADLHQTIDADDIMQEAHIRVFRCIGTLATDDPDAFERWVDTIAINRLRGELRKQRALKRGGRRAAAAATPADASSVNLLDAIAASSGTPSRVVATREAVAEVQAAIEALPAQYAQAIRSVYLEGRSVRETAEALGRTERAVHGLCRQALRRLRDHLEKRALLISS